MATCTASSSRAAPRFDAFRDPEAQRDLLAEVFDVVSQIRMPRWSSGRVALVGDLAYAPSFLTGQGSSLALVGAYMLGGSLAAERDHAAGFATCERDTRAFMTLNLDQVGKGEAALFPTTARVLEQRKPCRAVSAPCPRQRGGQPIRRWGAAGVQALWMRPAPVWRGARTGLSSRSSEGRRASGKDW